MKKPLFKTRIGTAYKGVVSLGNGPAFADYTKVRVVDAREPTPEQAVQKVLQSLQDLSTGWTRWCASIAKGLGMTATVVNGKVRVRKARKK